LGGSVVPTEQIEPSCLAGLACLPVLNSTPQAKETIMDSIKCPQCGLIFWNAAESCRRCGLLTEEFPTFQPDTPESFGQPAVNPTTGRHNQISDSDAERLLSNLKKDSRLFYGIGGVQVLLWFFVGQLLIVDGFINIGLSYLTFRFKSRVAAMMLALMTLLSVGVGLFTILVMGRFNFFIPLILIWRLGCSIRMIYTTFKLHAYEEVDVTTMMPPLPPVFRKEDAPQWSSQAGGTAQLQPE
jgi:hypothetical protein